MSLTPEKVKKILSSLIHEDYDSVPSENEGPGQNDDNSFCKKNLHLPRHKNAFIDRVNSYSPLTWFAKPLWLSPLHCARYGWRNMDTDTLQCVSCKAFITGRLPVTQDPNVYKECCKKVEDSLTDGHTSWCFWRTISCPENFLHSVPEDREEATAEFVQRCKILQSRGSSLPLIDADSMPGAEDQVDVLLSVVRNSELGNSEESVCDETDSKILSTACLLSLVGWEVKKNSKLSVLNCQFCRRDAGMWNYMTTESQNLSDDDEEPNEIEESPKPVDSPPAKVIVPNETQESVVDSESRGMSDPEHNANSDINPVLVMDSEIQGKELTDEVSVNSETAKNGIHNVENGQSEDSASMPQLPNVESDSQTSQSDVDGEGEKKASDENIDDSNIECPTAELSQQVNTGDVHVSPPVHTNMETEETLTLTLEVNEDKGAKTDASKTSTREMKTVSGNNEAVSLDEVSKDASENKFETTSPTISEIIEWNGGKKNEIAECPEQQMRSDCDNKTTTGSDNSETVDALPASSSVQSTTESPMQVGVTENASLSPVPATALEEDVLNLPMDGGQLISPTDLIAPNVPIPEGSPPHTAEPPPDVEENEEVGSWPSGGNNAQKREGEAETNHENRENTEQPASNVCNTDAERAQEPRRKKRKLRRRRSRFNPVGEHRIWCPWITDPSVMKTSALTSLSNSRSLHVEHCPGWKKLLQTLQPENSEEGPSFYDEMKAAQTADGLTSIRHLFDGWT